jgi:hypothetical protein
MYLRLVDEAAGELQIYRNPTFTSELNHVFKTTLPHILLTTKLLACQSLTYVIISCRKLWQIRMASIWEISQTMTFQSPISTEQAAMRLDPRAQ